MARITCRTPSAGKPIRVFQKNVTDIYTTLVEASDFSVPDVSQKIKQRDPSDLSRAIKPGEVFLSTPLFVTNTSTVDAEFTIQLVTETGDQLVIGSITVPPKDTGFIPLQGQSLLKLNPTSVAGDLLQVKVLPAGSVDVWMSAEERVADDHAGLEVQ